VLKLGFVSERIKFQQQSARFHELVVFRPWIEVGDSPAGPCCSRGGHCCLFSQNAVSGPCRLYLRLADLLSRCAVPNKS
jgi:hypothetical protein